MIDTYITPADLGAPNHHSCGCCSSRAIADFARTAVRAAAAQLSERRQVHAKLAEYAKRREEQQN